jgi:hypothetical protein
LVEDPIVGNRSAEAVRAAAGTAGEQTVGEQP